MDVQESLKSVGTQPGEGQAPRVVGLQAWAPQRTRWGGQPSWVGSGATVRGEASQMMISSPNRQTFPRRRGPWVPLSYAPPSRILRLSPAPYLLQSEPAGSQESLLAIGLSMIIQLIGRSRIIALPANRIN